MMMTFEEAREAVLDQYAGDWEDDDSTRGTFHVAEYGYEDADAYLMVVGAEEYVVGADPQYAIMDAPAVFVDKATGTLVLAEVLDIMDRAQAMTEVGDHPVEDEDPDA